MNLPLASLHGAASTGVESIAIAAAAANRMRMVFSLFVEDRMSARFIPCKTALISPAAASTSNTKTLLFINVGRCTIGLYSAKRGQVRAILRPLSQFAL